MARLAQACNSFYKQRCKAGRAVTITKVSTVVDSPSLWTLTRSAKLNGKVVAAIFSKQRGPTTVDSSPGAKESIVVEITSPPQESYAPILLKAA